ncbi:hypothetical protein [Streptomyces sp. NPDC086182]|jgi:DNA ligase-1|uniref:hypothetical protein n=1 Tax=Streptomyces sp. NPDC086182 TaxID=3155058 RepID=UPI00341FFF35
MLLSRLAHVSQEVAATSARSRKTAPLAELFRVVRYREDKTPAGADTVGTLLAAHPEVTR